LLRADQSPKSIKDRHGMPCRAAFFIERGAVR
jgi:hypothetical protein